MPRDLVIGNGSLQVMFDAAYRLRDVYFPNLGKENHTVGHPCRFGVFADGRLSWTDSPEWERRLGYEAEHERHHRLPLLVIERELRHAIPLVVRGLVLDLLVVVAPRGPKLLPEASPHP